MDKENLNYLWLSPEGETVFCDHEVIEARKILEERFKLDGPFYEPVKLLLNYGWMAYRHDEVLGRGWMIHRNRRPVQKFVEYGTIPTLAQREKILELFGREFDDSWITWEAVGI
jgi:hypothetical protein